MIRIVMVNEHLLFLFWYVKEALPFSDDLVKHLLWNTDILEI